MSIATVSVSPGPDHGPGLTGAASGTGDAIPWAEFRDGYAQMRRAGMCLHPVRLKGRVEAIDLATGEVRPVYDTSAEPDGELHVPCGNRRESVCPPCSAVYKGDARQLVKAGLTGGKGVPESVAEHPCVFATFTAPSFGPVHARRMRGATVLPCRPRRDAKVRVCPHGRDISCSKRHNPDDPRLGRALCGDCYDYTAAVLFNAHAPDLWRRFCTYLPRHLARLAGVTQKALRAVCRPCFVKVHEYQHRGVIHYHAVIRLDAPGESCLPPPARYGTDLLCQAVKDAAAAVSFPVGPDDDHPDCPAILLRFGPQTDTKPIRPGDDLPATGARLSAQAVANYVAKYSIKSLDVPGLPGQRIGNRLEIESLRCSRHHQRMVTTAWELGGGTLVAAKSRLCRWAHQLGHGGHFMTKSRRYSVTFGQFRRARREHQRAQRHPDGERDPWGRPIDETVVVIRATWSYAGTGYASAPAAELALASAARARAHER